jgi:class 3 adenylate cyclase/tetratricopeptide (TPR) repeat protein
MVPPAIAPPPTEPAEERRWATVVFADVCGFTGLSERMDPEDVRTLIDGCLRDMGRIVEDLGGFVSRLAGDELLAVFGAPVALGDDPERAVRAALEMECCVSAGTADRQGLSLRVGVNTGEMVFGPVGPDSRRELTVYGDEVNVGKRLQEAAPPGGVLVGEGTWQATRWSIHYAEVGPILVKGKASPVGTWRALSPAAEPVEHPLSVHPMVGRDQEVGVLSSIWDRVVKEGQGYLVTVLGPAGIGKTRLEREFSLLVMDQGGRVLRGRSLPYGEQTGYGAFALQVKGLGGILETDRAPAVRAKLERFLAPLFPGEWANDLASQLALFVGVGEETPTADRQSLFFLARRLVEAVARDRPTVFVFEDLHWADPSLLDLLDYLAGRVRDAPVLFLTLARPELLDTRPNWGGGLPASATLPLEALSADASRNLALRLLPDDAPPVTVERLADTAGGNPLFLEELAASLTETGLTASELPTSVRGTIAARIDALPPDARSALLNASVIGKLFWVGALERLAPGGGQEKILALLEARDFVRRQPVSRLEGDQEYAFKHMLIREVAYSVLPRAARRERHGQVARFLEERAGDRLTESASLLAHHWRQAGDDARTLQYLVMAGDHARRGWAKSEAVDLYAEALELAPDPTTRRQILIQRVEALSEGGDYEAVIHELDELLPELTGRDELEAMLKRAEAAYWLLDGEGTRRFARRAVELADNLGADDLRGPALAMLSQGTTHDGSVPQALVIAEQAFVAWLPGEQPRDFANHSAMTGMLCYWTGQCERAVELCRRGYELGMELRAIEEVLLGGGNLGMALMGLGRHEEALRVLERVVAQGRELEIVPRWTARALNMWSGALRELFALDEARARNEEAIEFGKASGFLLAALQGRTDLLFTDLLEGEPGRADRIWPGLWREAGKLEGWHEWLIQGRLAYARAEIDLARGKPEEAAASASDALAQARRVGRLKYEVTARTVLGAALLELKRGAESVGELRAALAGAERLAHPPTTWRAAGRLAAALTATGDDEGAEHAYARLTATIDAFVADLTEERRARFLAAPQVSHALALGR